MHRIAMDITLSHNRTMSVQSYMSIVGYRVSSLIIYCVLKNTLGLIAKVSALIQVISFYHYKQCGNGFSFFLVHS